MLVVTEQQTLPPRLPITIKGEVTRSDVRGARSSVYRISTIVYTDIRRSELLHRFKNLQS